MLSGFVFSSDTQAACNLVDPVQGQINITCRDARLTVSTDGMRSLPHPNDVALGTKLQIKWVQPFSGNTNVQSWDADNQTSHFWQYVNGQWINRPDEAIMQEIGSLPSAKIELRRMPNRQRGWAVIRMNDLMIWNGGN